MPANVSDLILPADDALQGASPADEAAFLPRCGPRRCPISEHPAQCSSLTQLLRIRIAEVEVFERLADGHY